MTKRNLGLIHRHVPSNAIEGLQITVKIEIRGILNFQKEGDVML